MNIITAKLALKRRLKFGDSQQIAAYERLEAQQEMVNRLECLTELLEVPPESVTGLLGKWDIYTLRQALNREHPDMDEAELRMARAS